MAVVSGGSKMNLVTGLSEFDGSNIDYGRHRWLAQTFTLTDTYVVWRFRFKSWTRCGGEFYHYGLRLTGPEGAPTAEDIYHTQLSPTGEHWHSPGRWRRFDFSGFPTLAPGLYALVASVPTASHNWCYKLRASSPIPPFTQGKAWQSDDDGETWVELPGIDLLFECWGYQPPPDPPPPPVIGNWAVLDLEQVYEYLGYTIKITTDNMCHLYMRRTWTEPLKHPQTEVRRGLSVPIGTRYCFVNFDEQEQEESGDTLIHEFKILDFPVCSTLWYYFIGTKQAEEMPSSSPIFHKHKPPPPKPFYFYLNPTGNGYEQSIRFYGSIGLHTHWECVRYEDTYFDGSVGPWGVIIGNYVYEMLWYNDNYYRDLYVLEDPPDILEPIVNVKLWLKLYKNAYPYGKFKHSIRTHGVTYDTPPKDISLFTPWQAYSWPLNPFTGQPWTVPELIELQAGVVLGKAASYGRAACDRLYLEIEI